MAQNESTQAAQELFSTTVPLTEDVGVPRYFIDLPVFDEIHRAIEAKDEMSLWQQLERSSDPAVFMDWIGNAATGIVR